MENGKFIQISNATITTPASQSVMIYVLEDQGHVWKCVEGGQPRVTEPKWILMKRCSGRSISGVSPSVR